MADTAAPLLSPRRLVVWYLILALVGVVLMLTAGPPNTFEPSPVMSPPPASIAEDADG